MDGTLSILILSYFWLPTVHGYVYFIRPKDVIWDQHKPPYYCYTNESRSAIAFARQNAQDLLMHTMSGKVGYRSILNQPYFDDGRSDCNLLRVCDQWNSRDFDRVSNFQNNTDQFPPVFDRRWNDFPENVISSDGLTSATLIELENDSEGVIYVSVLASKAAIVFSRGDSGTQGFTISLDDNDDHQEHSIKPLDPNSQSEEVIVHDRRALSRAWKWTMISIKYKLANFNISLEVEAGKKKILKFQDVNAGFDDSQPTWKVTAINEVANSDEGSFYKLNKYEVLKPKKHNSTMWAEVDFLSNQPFCLDVTYFSSGKEPTGIVATVENSKGQTVFNSTFGASPKDSWVTERIKIEELEMETYRIEIKTKSEMTFLGDTRFCVLGPEVVETQDLSFNCHRFKGDEEPTEFSPNENGLSTLEADNLCSIMGEQYNCQGITYCIDDVATWSRKCACLSGYETENLDDTGPQCDTSCASTKRYGPNCKFNFTGNCIEDEYNIHNGFCMYGCKGRYRLPSCLRRLLEFDVLPEVTEIGAYDALVNLTAAMEALQETRKNETKFFYSVEIMLQQELFPHGSGVWSTPSTVKTINRSGPFQFFLQNLLPATNYKFQTLIREDEKDNDNQTDSTAETVEFTTQDCITLGTSDSKLRTQVHIVREENRKNECHKAKEELESISYNDSPTQYIELVLEGSIITQFENLNVSRKFVIAMHGEDGRVLFLKHDPDVEQKSDHDGGDFKMVEEKRKTEEENIGYSEQDKPIN